MSMSCSCDYEGGDWYYYKPADYSILETKRARRCCSCGERIVRGDTVVKFRRARQPKTEIEDRIWGEGSDIPLASWFMCEACGDQFFNLTELGFCITLPDSMTKLVKEYAEMQREYRERGKG